MYKTGHESRVCREVLDLVAVHATMSKEFRMALHCVCRVQAEGPNRLAQFNLTSEGTYEVYNLTEMNFHAAHIRFGMSVGREHR